MRPGGGRNGDAGAVEVTHRSGIAIRQDRFGAKFFRAGFQLACDFVECFVPADAGKTALPFGASAPQGIKQAVGRVFTLEITSHFSAEESARHRMRRIAAQLRTPSRMIDVY